MPPIQVQSSEKVVRTGESWFSIARQQLGEQATGTQVAAFAQELANVNGGLGVLRSGRTIRIPGVQVSQEAAPSKSFMDAANALTASYKTGGAPAPGTAPGTSALPQSPLYPKFQHTPQTPLSAITGSGAQGQQTAPRGQSLGFGGQMVGGRYAEAGLSPSPTVAPTSTPAGTPSTPRSAATGLTDPSHIYVRGRGTPGASFSNLFKPEFLGFVENFAARIGEYIASAREYGATSGRTQAIAQARGQSSGTYATYVGGSSQQPSAAQSQPQTPRQAAQAVVKPYEGGETYRMELSELRAELAVGAKPVAISTIAAYGAGLTPQQLVASGYEFTSTGYWVLSSEIDILDPTGLVETVLGSDAPTSETYYGSYGSPYGVEMLGGSYSGGPDVNGGYTPNPAYNPGGNVQSSWRIGF